MSKQVLRQVVLEKMKQEMATGREQASRRLMERLIASPHYQSAQTIATYLSLPHEVDTQFLIDRALQDGKTVLVPKVVGRGQMIFVVYDKDDLVAGAYGILEPRSSQAVAKTDIELIHVPGVVFRQDGYRIGYGGGFYDRYLADYQGMTVGTALACQLCHFSKDDHDRPVKELICDASDSELF